MRNSFTTLRVLSWLVLAGAQLVSSAQSAPAANPALDTYRRAVLAQKGDFGRGQKVYENTEVSQCRKCHAIEGVGSIVGPDLLGVGSRYDRATLLDTIIEPSSKIHPDYAATIIVTKAGKIHTGITRQINEKDLEIVASETEKVRVPLDEVAERKASPVSAMPAGLNEKISPAQMADLLTYLAQLKASRAGSRQEALDVREIPRSIDYVKFIPILEQSQIFQRPVWYGPIPGRPEAQLVLEIDQAKIWLLEREGAKTRKSLFIDLTDETTGGEFTGLMSLAFHPEFLKNRRYFLKLHALPPDGKPKTRENALQVNIIERKFSADFRADSGEPSKIIIKIPCFTVFHHGGDLAFGPDGFLYSTMGDTGPQGDPDGHAQDLSVLNGKMFRIDVDRKEGDLPYAIPPDNPFRDRPGARPEIWALGFREIWRHCFDPATGDLWAAEVGQNRFEEIILVRRGENYGWNVMEGFQPYSDAYRSKDAKYAGPLFAYGHSIGPSVTGGFVYRGKKHPALFGKYIFGDYETRHVWALEQRDRKVVSVVEIGRAPDKFGAFGLDAEGELYLVGLDYGMIYRLEPANADLSPATARDIIQTAREAGETWRYSTTAPSSSWFAEKFDDKTWAAAPGAFGVQDPPGAKGGSPLVPGPNPRPSTIRTEWKTPEIWLRRDFSFAPRAADDGAPSAASKPYIFKFVIRNKGEAEVYLNGVLAARASGTDGEYAEVQVLPAARAAIRNGLNVLAVHCKANGGNHIDVGMVELQKVD